MSLKRIAARLGVSPSSVFAWTRDIELSAEQRRRLLIDRPHDPEVVARRTEAARSTRRRRREAFQLEGRARARRGDLRHAMGCMLFWAEGSKERNSVKFCNSDPNMLRTFRDFLVVSLGVSPETISLRLHVYLGNGLSLAEIETYWLQLLELPMTALRRHHLNPLPTSSSGRKRNKLPYGVCTLTVHSTRLVQHLYGAIQEYAGFDEPRWLDGPPRKRARPG